MRFVAVCSIPFRSRCRTAGVSGWPGPSDAAVGRQPATLLLILGLHAVLAWGLMRDPRVRVPVPQLLPLFVRWVEPAPIRTPQPAPRLPAPVPVELPAPLPWLPPPEMPTRTAPQPVGMSLLPAPVAAPSVVAAAPVPDSAPAVTAPMPASAPPAPKPPAPAPAVEPAMLDAAQLRFTEAPQVDYPKTSRRNREAGVVWVRAWVGTGGGASADVRIDRSSGFTRLDEAALRAVQQARFAPALRHGRPTEGWALIPIRFELEA